MHARVLILVRVCVRTCEPRGLLFFICSYMSLFMCACLFVCVCVFLFVCMRTCVVAVCVFTLARARGRTGSRLLVRVCVYSCVFVRE